MLVLLPPSEGKAAVPAPAPAGRLELDALSLPELTEARAAVLDALVTLCASEPDKAAEVLGLSARLRGEVTRNAGLREAATLPAAELYTGVLYEALGLDSWDEAARQRAARSLLIFSGLWGAVRVSDQLPPYRCPIGVKLPGVGSLGRHWRGPMAGTLPAVAGSGMVLDLRSAAYASTWRPTGPLAARTATVRVLHARMVDGVEKRSVVSHFNKATKGRLVRDLLTAGAEPADPGELVDALRGLGHTVEVTRGPGASGSAAGSPWALDVVVSVL